MHASAWGPTALLLALLALRPGTVTPAERLIDDLWPEVPLRQPANALQVIVFKLRKAIGSELVETRPPGYVLHVERDHVVETLTGDSVPMPTSAIAVIGLTTTWDGAGRVRGVLRAAGRPPTAAE